MAQQKIPKVKFYGGVIKRVWVVYQKDSVDKYNPNKLNFIKAQFNKLRNYREFIGDIPVEIHEFSSEFPPRITSVKDDDACLLIGSGRLIDKESYDFAKKCFDCCVPVFFIRSNSSEHDPRAISPIWKSNSLIIKAGDSTESYIAPERYFMEIPSIDDLILTNSCDKFYALLPSMVPIM